MGGGDVEQDDLVCAVGGVAVRQLGGVARVDDVDELDALDHAAGATSRQAMILLVSIVFLFAHMRFEISSHEVEGIVTLGTTMK